MNTKSEAETRGEDGQYGKSNQPCQNHEKVIAAITKTKNKGKENQGDKTSVGDEDKNKK